MGKLKMDDALLFLEQAGNFDSKEAPIRVTLEAKDICLTEEDSILQEIRELCSGLALSDRARAARYDKIVEVLKSNDRH